MSALTKRGYAIPKSEIESVLDSIKKELSVSPFVPKGYKFGTKTFKLYQESEKNIYLPKFYGIQKFGHPLTIKIQGEDIKLDFCGNLRPEQITPVDKLIRACLDPNAMGGILNICCGGGKTTMALYTLTILAKKTLIIVHKDFLLEQWKERIGVFLPNAKIGIIKAKTVDIENKEIVLGSLQSLSMKDYDANIFSSFGTVIIDEVHHTSAEVFSKALAKVSFVYTIGLSATIVRKDGLSKVFKWYLGNVVYQSEKRKDNVIVKCVDFDDPNCEKYNENPILCTGKPNVAKMINNICDNSLRNNIIVEESIQAASQDRKILILSDRRMHLVELEKLIKSKGLEVGLYMGGMKSSILAECGKKQIIVATFAIASEGYDQPGLDTIILASPKSDVVQAVGRILRDKECDRKNIPLIIDIVDVHEIFQRQAQKRQHYYKQCNWIPNIQKSLFR